MANIAPQISIIMSTYNRESFLQRSIESVLNQTYPNFEFILVNNGSTDGSGAKCEQYAGKDRRIKLLHVPVNRGASIGRNKGLESASGEFVAFVDDDDFCEPQMLEFLWKLLCDYKADISICGSWNDFAGRLEPYFVFDELLLLNQVQGLEELLKREKYNVAPPAKLFRKTLFDGIRFKNNVLVDDIHVTYKLFANAQTVAAQGVPLYRFTKHQGNMTEFIQSNRLTPELLQEYLSAFRERTEYLSRKIPEIAQRAKYSEYSYMIAMCRKITAFQIRDCEKMYERMIERIQDNYEELLQSAFTTENEKQFIDAHHLKSDPGRPFIEYR